MKKLLLPLIACFVLFTGCTEKSRIFTSYYTVDPGKWELATTLNPDNTYNVDYAFSTWENIDITPGVIDNGVVLVYYIDDAGRDNILPYTLYLADDNGVPYQERIEYDIQEGLITFKIKDSDFKTQISLQSIKTMKFKVSVIR